MANKLLILSLMCVAAAFVAPLVKLRDGSLLLESWFLEDSDYLRSIYDPCGWDLHRPTLEFFQLKEICRASDSSSLPYPILRRCTTFRALFEGDGLDVRMVNPRTGDFEAKNVTLRDGTILPYHVVINVLARLNTIVFGPMDYFVGMGRAELLKDVCSGATLQKSSLMEFFEYLELVDGTEPKPEMCSVLLNSWDEQIPGFARFKLPTKEPLCV